MSKKTVWVFWRWRHNQLHRNGWIYLLTSKVAWQENVEAMKKSGHPYELLAESTDRALLQTMWDLTKD